jgi:hypothetical protein
MSDVSYEAFLPDVVQFVKDVPEIVAVQAIRNAAIQFCEKTRVLQTELTPMNSIVGVSVYPFEPDVGYKVVDIMEAWYGDQLLIPKAVEELTRIYRTSNWNDLDGNPYYHFRSRTQEITLVPKPQTSEYAQIKLRVAVVPSRASSVIDEEIFERYYEFITLGARARLYDTPDQPYYDPRSAQLYLKRFSDGMNEVRTRVAKGLTRASVQIEYQRFV